MVRIAASPRTALLKVALLRAAGCAAMGVVFAAAAASQSVKLIATVFDEKTGKPIEDLKAENFSVLDGKRPLRGRVG